MTTNGTSKDKEESVVQTLFRNLFDAYERSYTPGKSSAELQAAKIKNDSVAEERFITELAQKAIHAASKIKIDNSDLMKLINKDCVNVLIAIARLENEGIIELEFNKNDIKREYKGESIFEIVNMFENKAEYYFNILNYYRNLNANRENNKDKLKNDIVLSDLSPDQKAFALKLLESLQGKTCIVTKNDEAEIIDFDKNEVVAWEFKTDAVNSKVNPNTNNEINIFFHGTGTIPLFLVEHTFTHEGGNPLAHFAYEKAELGLPSLLVKGVGSVKTDEFAPVRFILDQTAPVEGGSAAEIAMGVGIHGRIQLAMEEFYIPKVIELIEASISNNKTEPYPLNVNISGHSRGAITTFAMADCVDKWMKFVRDSSPNEFEQMKVAIFKKYPHLGDKIDLALLYIKQNKVKLNTKIMALDPVEGAMAIGDTQLPNVQPKISVKLFDVGEPLNCQYSEMPDSVTEMNIRLAQDERRESFQPTIPSARPNTQLNIQVGVGTHSTYSGNTGNSDGAGQYRRFTDHFKYEAVNACIDLFELDMAQKMSQGPLPPIRFSILERVYENKSPYERTRKAIGDYINKLSRAELLVIVLGKKLELDKLVTLIVDSDKTGNTMKNISGMILLSQLRTLAIEARILTSDGQDIHKPLGGSFSFSNQSLVYIAEHILKKDPEFNRYIYYTLENDIYSNYLCSENIENRTKLSELQDEMRQDTTTVAKVGPVTSKLSVQNKDEDRLMFKRSLKSKNTLEHASISKCFPLLKPNPIDEMFYARNPKVGGIQKHQFVNPYYIRLSHYVDDFKFLDPQQQYQIDMIAQQLNDLGINYSLKSNEFSDEEKSKYKDKMKMVFSNLVNALNELELKDDLDMSKKQSIKNNVIALFINKSSYQYDSSYKENLLYQYEFYGLSGQIFDVFMNVLPGEQHAGIILTSMMQQLDNMHEFINDKSLNGIFIDNDIVMDNIIRLVNDVSLAFEHYISDADSNIISQKQKIDFYNKLSDVKVEFHQQTRQRALSGALEYLLFDMDKYLKKHSNVFKNEDIAALYNYQRSIQKIKDNVDNYSCTNINEVDQDIYKYYLELIAVIEKLKSDYDNTRFKVPPYTVPEKVVESIIQKSEIINMRFRNFFKEVNDIIYKANPNTVGEPNQTNVPMDKYSKTYQVSSHLFRKPNMNLDQLIQGRENQTVNDHSKSTLQDPENENKMSEDENNKNEIEKTRSDSNKPGK